MAEAGLKWVTLFDNQEASAGTDMGTDKPTPQPKKPKAPKQSKPKGGAGVGGSLFMGPGMTADSELHDLTLENEDGKGDAKGGNKRMSVERIYQKKSQLEHILLRPDTYIGSVETVTQSMWVYDDVTETMVQRELTFVPGLYKIFDEIIVNAADNKQRDPTMNCIKVDIDPEKNQIKVWNNGKGIPVVEHKTEKMYVPTLIFGHLLTSSNYDDSEKKVTGGRNGYGAKLCNIFSTKFTVETSSHEYRKSFKQTWIDNMTKTKDPVIGEARSDDYTCITFQPDLAKFKMTSLDADTVALFTRRAYDVAATTKGVRVMLNGKRLPVKSMKDYIDLFVKGKEDEAGQPLKVVFEAPHERWDVAVTLSDKGFQQVSFVNSIATTKGGRHVDYCVDHIVSKLIEVVKKKNKGGINIKPFQIKNHLWIFVNCLVENPTFDSQTKETMTLQAKSFGSRPVFTEKFVTQVSKCGVVESILSWMKFKAQAQLNKKCHASKHSKLKGIPKLDDANDAGTRNSRECTLILTEGDSAKSLAVAGLGVIGRDRYGVFPLRGKVLNVRDATHKQIMDNAEINNLVKIMGLQFKEKYDSLEDLKTLRYGKLMIMTDQDQDGSHIKGLIINFFHHFWPNLLKHNVIEEFITPIVKVAKGKQEFAFYSLPEFEEWKGHTDNWHTWKVKYYKGLGTSTSKEAKEYFSDMERHRIPFRYAGADDDASIHLAFSKKKCEERKEWLTNWMQERKRRAEMGLPELYLYGKNTSAISYNEFINRELILFSNMDLVRSIPSLVDGFKPGQRKVMFTCFKRNLTKEMKVAQLAGSVAEHSAYHHGEQALMGTIIGLAQNFVGSNNLNLLVPCGQFGTRIHGGKDAASPRYIFTHLSPLARLVYNIHDDPLLEPQFDDNLKIEPYWYCPILPMVLVNGAEGIGTGWSTKIPNYDIREIVANLKRMLDGLEPITMKPSFKDFKGTIEEVGDNRSVVSGEISIIDDNTVEITELPVRVWTQNYKEEVLEPMLHGTDKVPSIIQDYKEYHTDATVKFVVKMTSEQLAQAEEKGLHKVFKLQTSIATSSMVLFDHNGVIKRYSKVEEILREFYDLRLDYYHRRKDYLDGMLTAESLKLDNIARFILEKIEGTIVIENKPKKELIQLLVRRGYDSDPVKAWKESQSKGKDDGEDEEDDDASDASGTSGPDFNYILNMALWCLTKERKDELLKQRDGKRVELATLREKSPRDLWQEDLEEFLVKLDEVEAQEKEDAVVHLAAGKPGKGGRVKPRKVHLQETKPSPMGRRVEPRIDSAMKMKFQKDADRKRKIKEKKEAVAAGEDLDGMLEDEDGMEIKPLAQRLKFDTKDNAKPDAKPKVKRSRAPKGTKSPAGKAKRGGKKRNPWSDEESDVHEISDLSDLDNGDASLPVIPRDTAPRRAAAAKVSYKFEDMDESDGGLVSDDGSFKAITSDKEDDYSASIIPDSPPPKPKVNTAPSGPTITADFSDDNSDDSFHMEIESNSQPTQSSLGVGGDSDNDIFKPKSAAKPPKPPAQKKPRAKKVDPLQPTILSAFAALGPEGKEDGRPKAAGRKPVLKKKAAGRMIIDSDDDDDDVKVLESPLEKSEEDKPKKPRKKKAEDGFDTDKPKKKAKKTKAALSDDARSDDEFVPEEKKKRRAAPKKKKADGDDEDDVMDVDSLDVVPRSRPGRARATIKYTFDEDEDDDDGF